MFEFEFFALAIFVIANLIGLILTGLDKARSRRGTSGAGRISEGTIFFVATTFGALGVLVGMFLFRHKTRKWYFLIGIPLLVIENLATLSFFVSFFQNG